MHLQVHRSVPKNTITGNLMLQILQVVHDIHRNMCPTCCVMGDQTLQVICAEGLVMCDNTMYPGSTVEHWQEQQDCVIVAIICLFMVILFKLRYITATLCPQQEII